MKKLIKYNAITPVFSSRIAQIGISPILLTTIGSWVLLVEKALMQLGLGLHFTKDKGQLWTLTGLFQFNAILVRPVV